MREHTYNLSRARVVADEGDGAHVRMLDALHHDQVLVAAGQHGGPPVEFLEQQVAHGGVRFVDDDIGGAGVEEARDRRVDVRGEHPAATLPLLGTWSYVGRPGDPGALHVRGDEDLHGFSMAGKGGPPQHLPAARSPRCLRRPGRARDVTVPLRILRVPVIVSPDQGRALSGDGYLGRMPSLPVTLADSAGYTRQLCWLHSPTLPVKASRVPHGARLPGDRSADDLPRGAGGRRQGPGEGIQHRGANPDN